MCDDRRDPVLEPVREGLLQLSHRKNDPVEVLADLRSGIEDLPETAATFKLKRVLDDHTAKAVRPIMITLAGSWEVREELYTSERQDSYVNPDYLHRDNYTDAAVRCGCGAVMIRHEEIRGGKVIANEHEHGDDCTRADRLRGKARMYERRAEIVEELLKAGRPPSKAAKRMSLSASNQRNIGHLSEAMDLPTEEWRERGRAARLNTELELLARGHTAGEVGEVWGITAGSVRGRIATKTDYDIAEVRERGLEVFDD